MNRPRNAKIAAQVLRDSGLTLNDWQEDRLAQEELARKRDRRQRNAKIAVQVEQDMGLDDFWELGAARRASPSDAAAAQVALEDDFWEDRPAQEERDRRPRNAKIATQVLRDTGLTRDDLQEDRLAQEELTRKRHRAEQTSAGEPVEVSVLEGYHPYSEPFVAEENVHKVAYWYKEDEDNNWFESKKNVSEEEEQARQRRRARARAAGVDDSDVPDQKKSARQLERDQTEEFGPDEEVDAMVAKWRRNRYKIKVPVPEERVGERRPPAQKADARKQRRPPAQKADARKQRREAVDLPPEIQQRLERMREGYDEDDREHLPPKDDQLPLKKRDLPPKKRWGADEIMRGADEIMTYQPTA